MKQRSKEFANFDAMMGKVLKASHDDVKAALDAEKKKKPPKKKRASGHVSGGKG